jgi:predicted chitinase
MRADEFTIVEKKKRKRKLKGAAWGPGPYGGYGYATGYSGSAGSGSAVGDGGGVGEGWKDVAAAGALGTALALGGGNAKAQSYNEPQQQVQTVQVPTWQEQLKAAIKDGDIPNGEKIQIQRDGGWITKVVVDGKIYDIEHRIPKLGKNLRNAASQLRKAMGNENVEEDWRHWVAGLGAASALAGGGSAAYDAYKASQAEKEPTAVVAKSNFKKGAERLAKDAVPKQLVTGSPHEKFLTKAAVDAGIKGEELAQFLGQTAHESHNFKTMIEYGNTNYFKKYEPKFAKDKKTKKFIIDPKTKKPKNFNPKAVELGNDMPGDGEKYKGRGYIQLTGKYNYAQASKALGLDLVKNPQLVEKPEIAAKVAVWFWQNRVKPKVSDFGDTKASTKPINPGLKHLDQRKEKFSDFKTAMK